MYAVKYFNFNQQSSWASSLTDENICAALCLQKKTLTYYSFIQF